mmetsp:Transcript_32304/g.80041  ORF Transcript_32304/g.80041 Transcript_32304/m.80041 type:complete len:224 (+) Transcript_32304:264-935(+)|eukprot:3048781-Prymnesium_polylepis.1
MSSPTLRHVSTVRSPASTASRNKAKTRALPRPYRTAALAKPLPPPSAVRCTQRESNDHHVTHRPPRRPSTISTRGTAEHASTPLQHATCSNRNYEPSNEPVQVRNPSSHAPRHPAATPAATRGPHPPPTPSELQPRNTMSLHATTHRATPSRHHEAIRGFYWYCTDMRNRSSPKRAGHTHCLFCLCPAPSRLGAWLATGESSHRERRQVEQRQPVHRGVRVTH